MIYFAKIRLFSALSCSSPEYPCQTFTQQLNLCGREIVQPSLRRITRNIVRIALQYLKNPLRLNNRLKRLISADVNDARLVSLWIMSTARRNKPLLAPSNPSLLPAMLRSWHGLPAHTISAGGIAAPSIFVISPICVTSGKWRAVTEHGNGSISLDQSGLTPA